MCLGSPRALRETAGPLFLLLCFPAHTRFSLRCFGICTCVLRLINLQLRTAFTKWFVWKRNKTDRTCSIDLNNYSRDLVFGPNWCCLPLEVIYRRVLISWKDSVMWLLECIVNALAVLTKWHWFVGWHLKWIHPCLLKRPLWWGTRSLSCTLLSQCMGKVV